MEKTIERKTDEWLLTPLIYSQKQLLKLSQKLNSNIFGERKEHTVNGAGREEDNRVSLVNNTSSKQVSWRFSLEKCYVYKQDFA